MGIEIERKFLVDKQKWDAVPKPQGMNFRQGYILNSKQQTVRIRVADESGYINLKSALDATSRHEFEYEIPLEEAKQILDLFAKTQIQKIRYEIEVGGKIWEIDVFSGDNEGLIVAEIELDDASEAFEKPDWVTNEVTTEGRYTNSALINHPFKDW